MYFRFGDSHNHLFHLHSSFSFHYHYLHLDHACNHISSTLTSFCPLLKSSIPHVASFLDLSLTSLFTFNILPTPISHLILPLLSHHQPYPYLTYLFLSFHHSSITSILHGRSSCSSLETSCRNLWVSCRIPCRHPVGGHSLGCRASERGKPLWMDAKGP